MARNHESGKGAAGCLIALLLVVIVGMIAYKAIPARIAVAELQDYCEDQAEKASLDGFTDENIAKSIHRKAQELKLPVQAEDIKVRRDGGQVYINVDYVMPLRFPGYTYRWTVNHDIARVLF